MTGGDTAYDRVPYSNHAYHQTHPDTLATVARLRGLDAPAPSTASVLELGCGAGGNLVGLAYASPAVRAVGVDLAPTAIEQARELARRVGLGNVDFQVGDVTELADGRLGPFDYVTVHGVYAWVPDGVRDALLAAVAAHLAPGGLAYVSYNAQPTGRVRSVLREAALWWGREAATPEDLADRARELFGAMRGLRFGPEADDWYGRLVGHELATLERADDAEIVHDLLGDAWRPVWFADFAAHAAAHGLGYVGQARLGEHRGYALPEGLDEVLDELAGGDGIARRQYVDILTQRAFRESVLCHAQRAPAGEALHEAAFAELSYRPGPADLGPDDPPALRTALDALRARRPQAVPFAELVAATGVEADELRGMLAGAFRRGIVNPHTDLPAAGRPGERPRASAVARLTAAQGDRVTTLYNGIVFLQDPLGRALITLMDGTRDRDELLQAFREATGVEVTREVLDSNIASLGEIPLFHE